MGTSRCPQHDLDKHVFSDFAMMMQCKDEHWALYRYIESPMLTISQWTLSRLKTAHFTEKIDQYLYYHPQILRIMFMRNFVTCVQMSTKCQRCCNLTKHMFLEQNLVWMTGLTDTANVTSPKTCRFLTRLANTQPSGPMQNRNLPAISSNCSCWDSSRIHHYRLIFGSNRKHMLPLD